MATGFAATKIKPGSALAKALMVKSSGAKGADLLPIKAFGLSIGPSVWLPMVAGALGGAVAWSVIKAYEVGKTLTARGRKI
jgi:hypothetical protein|tara:strand:+ start:425 stop:667 length:243 start_codon:yes stop_codon:yes gene_type:complete